MSVDLAVPQMRIARRGRGGVGHFVSAPAFDRFLDAYRTGMSLLPPFDARWDVPTSLGSVRVYRFGGPDGTPVVLLPGRNASTPMWRANLPGLVRHRTVYCVDILGEPGLSVQRRPLTDADDQARWFDETLDGLGLASAHLMGVSFGGWTVTNSAVRRPGRAVSLTLLDPVMTFARVPLRTMLAVMPMGMPGVPETVRRRVLRWLSGGAAVDDSVPEAALIAAGTAGFALRQPMPTLFTDDELRALRCPVLALIAGRSVIHNADRAAGRARKLLPRGEVELWPAASHAISGEFPEEIAERAHRFWSSSRGSGPR